MQLRDAYWYFRKDRRITLHNLVRILGFAKSERGIGKVIIYHNAFERNKIYYQHEGIFGREFEIIPNECGAEAPTLGSIKSGGDSSAKA